MTLLELSREERFLIILASSFFPCGGKVSSFLMQETVLPLNILGWLNGILPANSSPFCSRGEVSFFFFVSLCRGLFCRDRQDFFPRSSFAHPDQEDVLFFCRLDFPLQARRRPPRSLLPRAKSSFSLPSFHCYAQFFFFFFLASVLRSRPLRIFLVPPFSFLFS